MSYELRKPFEENLGRLDWNGENGVSSLVVACEVPASASKSCICQES